MPGCFHFRKILVQFSVGDDGVLSFEVGEELEAGEVSKTNNGGVAEGADADFLD